MHEGEHRYGWQSAAEHYSHDYLLAAIRALLPSGERLSILDAGCGNGYLSAQIAAMGHSVLGVDDARDGIELARAAFPDVRFEQVSVYADLSSHMPRGGWDLILACEVIEHLYSPRKFLLNMNRHLRDEGRLIVTTPYHGYLKNLAISFAGGWDRHFAVDWEGGHIKFFSVRTLEVLLRDVGFAHFRYRNAGRVPLLWKSIVCECAKRAM